MVNIVITNHRHGPGVVVGANSFLMHHPKETVYSASWR